MSLPRDAAEPPTMGTNPLCVCVFPWLSFKLNQQERKSRFFGSASVESTMFQLCRSTYLIYLLTGAGSTRHSKNLLGAGASEQFLPIGDLPKDGLPMFPPDKGNSFVSVMFRLLMGALKEGHNVDNHSNSPGCSKIVPCTVVPL